MEEFQTGKRPQVMLHMDGDAFFVAVEMAKNPELKGKPVVTGQERGIVSSLSYEAKALGVERTMTIYSVKKNFPQVIVLSGDYASYLEYSKKMFAIVRRYADDVEEYSIDECFACLTGLDKPLKMSYRDIAERIKREVRDELDLSVTIGLAPNKVLAKVASKWVKPNGFTVIDNENKEQFLAEFDINKVWGIGPQTSALLKKQGIVKALDFARKDFDWVRYHLSKTYVALWRELHGESVLPLNPATKVEYSSIQRTRTFHPSTSDLIFLMKQLSSHIEDATSKARHYALTPRMFSFFLKDSTLKVYSITITLPYPTNAPEVLIGLLESRIQEVHSSRILYRASGVTLHGLFHNIHIQNDLFGNSEKMNKFEAIHKNIDALEQKFGKHVVHLGSTGKSVHSNESKMEMETMERNLLFM